MAEVRTPPKKLVDLNPRWTMTTAGECYGISYDCPCGLPGFNPDNGVPYTECCENGTRQVVPVKMCFAGMVVCASSQERGWDATGDGWETLTLTPSIHQVGHWHGFLTDGVLISC